MRPQPFLPSFHQGAMVNAVDAEQQTPLHLAVRANCPVEPELVKTLIRHDANLDHADTRGQTPLHFLPSAQVGVGAGREL